MIHIAIGTKAQFIKMAPIMQRLKEKNIGFNLIDLGQHALITRGLREEFGLKHPDVCLSKEVNVSRLSQGIKWIIELVCKGLSRQWVKEKVFLNKEGICLIQGDTVSTLLALYLAKRGGITVAHIEAGLRSYNYFEPFPEEIVRVFVMRFSDMLFAPSVWAMNNLKKMKLEKKTILISANTSLESTFYSLGKEVTLSLPVDKYSLITVHRMENIFSRKRLELVVNLVKTLSYKLPVIFVRHPPTIHQLKRFKLDKELAELKNVYFFTIVSHRHFIHLLKRCELVITDGGSIQEESYYLDKPCLLLRNCTERIEGLEENVCLSTFSSEKINFFITNYKSLKRKTSLINTRPSFDIIEHITHYA